MFLCVGTYYTLSTNTMFNDESNKAYSRNMNWRKELLCNHYCTYIFSFIKKEKGCPSHVYI